jgi:hypothetical protein
VGADGQGLDEGELLEAERPGDVELVGRDDELVPQPALGVDAEDLKLNAAVALAAPAGDAGAAVEVRLDGAAISGLDVHDAGTNFENFDAEFVADEAGIGEEGLAAFEGVDIGTADTDTMDADEGFAGTGGAGGGVVGKGEAAGGFEDESLHMAGGRSVAG